MRARGQAAWGAEGRVQPGGTHSSPKPHQPGECISLLLRNPSRELPHLPTSPYLILLPRQGTIPLPLCLLPSPTLSFPHAWIRYIPPALPDVSIPSSPDRAIIYQVVSRVVGEGGPGGRGFVSSLCWSSTGPSSLVSSQLLRVAGVREQMLKGLPFICGLILLPFHFILPASGMLLASTPPHPPRYHSACMFLREQELIFHVLLSSPSSAASPVTSPLRLWVLVGVVLFGVLLFFSSFTTGLFLILESKVS